MNKSINTNKYLLSILAVLTLAVFSVAKPALADGTDIGGYYPTGTDVGGYYPTGTDIGGYYPTGTDIGGYYPTGTDIGGYYPTGTDIGGYYPTGTDIGGYYPTDSTPIGGSGGTLTYNPGTTVSNDNPFGGSVYSSGGTTVYYDGGTYYGGGYIADPYYPTRSPAMRYSYNPAATTNVVSDYTSPTQGSVTYDGTNPAPTYYYPSNGTTIVDSGVPNQVLAYSDTRSPQLSSVYLSDVPYTGIGDNIRVSLFILGILLWSLFATFMILRKKSKMQFAEVSVIENSKSENDGESYISALDSDSRDIASIETYARDNNVLLSTDAAKRLVKLERLGGANSKDLINKISGSDWKAIGEKDLEKYL